MTTSPVRQRLTTDDFYAQYPESNTPVELIEGEVIVSPSPLLKHQVVTGRLHVLLMSMNLTQSGLLLFAPFDVRLDEDTSVQPDLLWLAPDRVSLATERRIEGAPDLVVEVISPGSVRMDRVVKFRLYERFGVREYWIADPEGVIEVFALRDGRFALLGMYESGETFESPLLGQPVPLAGLFA
jgi:Uma2 family endonuclease